MKVVPRSAAYAALALCLALPGAFSAPGAQAAGEVVIAEQTWTGAIATSNIMKYVIENKLGVKARIMPLDQAATWKALDKGSVHIKGEVWLPNEENFTNEYVKGKDVIEMTTAFENARQGWLIPAWVAKEHNIKDYKDLSKNSKLFDINGNGKGDLWAGGFGWSITQQNEIILRDLNVDLEPLVLEQWVFLAQMKEAMRTKKPIVFFYWEPEWIFAKYDFHWIELPPYDPAQWKFVDKKPEESKITCGLPSALVTTAYRADLKEKNPKVYTFLKNYFFPKEDQNALIADLEDLPDNPKQDPAEVAKKWVESNPDIVNKWLAGI